MAGTLTITGMAAGLLSGEKDIGPQTMTGTTTVGTITDVTLSTGDNTIAVPAGAVAVLIVISSTNTAQLKLRTNIDSGDTGVSVGPTGFVVLPLYAGTSSLIVNATAGGATIEATFI